MVPPKVVTPVPPFDTESVPEIVESVRQVLSIAKQPAAMFQPPVLESVDVAVVKLALPPTENREPGEEVAMPTKELGVIASAGVDDVANVLGDVVAR